MEGEGFEDRAAGVLSQAGHLVTLTALLWARCDIHPILRVDGRVLIEIVVRPKDDPAPVPHGNCVRDVLSVRDVKEASGYPGNQVLEDRKTLWWLFAILLSPNQWTCHTNSFHRPPWWISHLIFDTLIVLNVLAEVDCWSPDVVLIVQTATSLLRVVVLGYGHFIPVVQNNKQKRKRREAMVRERVSTPDWRTDLYVMSCIYLFSSCLHPKQYTDGIWTLNLLIGIQMVYQWAKPIPLMGSTINPRNRDPNWTPQTSKGERVLT